MATNKRAVEAWWGFLAGAIIVIVVAIVVLALYGKIGIGSQSAVLGIKDTIGNIFK